MKEFLVERFREVWEQEALSCSMDFGCVTPKYVSQMWAGDVSKEEIAAALKGLKSSGFGL